MPTARYNRYTTCTIQGDATGYSEQLNRARQVFFTLAYRFGRLKASVKKADHTIENNDVVGGISRGRE